MKKALCILSLLIFCCPILHAEERFPYLAQITDNKVNVRAGQSKNYESLIRLNSGDKVVVVDKNYSWYKVKLPSGAKCFVSSQYIRKLSSTIGEITANRVNIRAGKGGNFSVMGQLSKGIKVRIHSQDGEWTKIEPMEGIYGWVNEDFLEYRSKTVPPPKIVEAPTRNVYKMRKQARLEEELQQQMRNTSVPLPEPVQTIEEQKAANQPTPFTATGKVQKLKGTSSKEARHKLIVDDETVYYLKGPKTILDRFINYNVKVDGELYSEPSQLSSPTIKVNKIRFIL